MPTTVQPRIDFVGLPLQGLYFPVFLPLQGLYVPVFLHDLLLVFLLLLEVLLDVTLLFLLRHVTLALPLAFPLLRPVKPFVPLSEMFRFYPDFFWYFSLFLFWSMLEMSSLHLSQLNVFCSFLLMPVHYWIPVNSSPDLGVLVGVNHLVLPDRLE